MTGSKTYNSNPWLKHCLEALPGQDRLLVKLFAIGSGHVIVNVELPVSGPRVPEDRERISYLRKLCEFYARASNPSWSWPESAP